MHRWSSGGRSRPVLARALIAAGGLCAIASLVFLWIVASPEPDGAKDQRMGNSKDQAISKERIGSGSGTVDPAGTLARICNLENRSERENRIRDFLSAWAIRDAEAALDWVSSVEDSAARRSALSNVCMAVAENDPRRAVTLALAHGADKDDLGGLLEYLTMQWCERETAAVVEWAQAQPRGDWRDRLLSRVSFVLSKSDPAAAADLVSDLEPGAVQDEAAMAVLHQWALQDSDAALQWAEAFSEPNLRDRALAEISNLRNPTASHAVE